MAEFFKFNKQIFQDVDGAYSSKRVVALIAFLFLLVCGVVNLAWSVTVAEFIFEGFIWIVLGGLGITIGEHFASVFKARTERSG